MTATLSVKRDWLGAADRRRTWQIVLDGEAVGEIRMNDTVELPVEPGEHRLQLTSTKQRRSPERSFDAKDGAAVSFICHPQALWPLALIALAKPGHWIVLRQR